MLDWLAHKLGYVPSELVQPRWQRIDVPFSPLVDLKAGERFNFSVWVLLPARFETSWWFRHLMLERKDSLSPYVLTNTVDNSVVAEGER